MWAKQSMDGRNRLTLETTVSETLISVMKINNYLANTLMVLISILLTVALKLRYRDIFTQPPGIERHITSKGIWWCSMRSVAGS